MIIYRVGDIHKTSKKISKRLNGAMSLFSRDTADEALSEFLDLIDLGCDEAFSFVGNLYECGGRNVRRDYLKARFYYEQSIERVGSVAAYLGLIRIYYYGLGVECDYRKAFEYCSILANEENDPYANFYLGKMYMGGLYVDENIKEAMVYFDRSWGGGYVFGLTYLGLCSQKDGRLFKGWIYRLRAAYHAYKIGRRNIRDPRIRELSYLFY